MQIIFHDSVGHAVTVAERSVVSDHGVAFKTASMHHPSRATLWHCAECTERTSCQCREFLELLCEMNDVCHRSATTRGDCAAESWCSCSDMKTTEK